MILSVVMTTLCLAGIVFNVRFLMALCQSPEARWIFYWTRLHTSANESTISEVQTEVGENQKALDRAA
jgi:hypothetical protein